MIQVLIHHLQKNQGSVVVFQELQNNLPRKILGQIGRNLRSFTPPPVPSLLLCLHPPRGDTVLLNSAETREHESGKRWRSMMIHADWIKGDSINFNACQCFLYKWVLMNLKFDSEKNESELSDHNHQTPFRRLEHVFFNWRCFV